MIAHVDGKVSEKGEGLLVIDCGGVGFALNVSQTTLADAPAVGQPFKAVTRMSVREDAIELFGFSSRQERSMFDRLTEVNRVGPKLALGILSAMSAGDLARALALGDVQTLKRVPGVGLKTAQRLVLELREKIGNEELLEAVGSGGAPIGGGVAGSGMPDGPFAQQTGDERQQQAVSALMSLDYTSAEAARAVNLAIAEAPDALVGEIIRRALQKGR